MKRSGSQPWKIFQSQLLRDIDQIIAVNGAKNPEVIIQVM